jgi:hypothetical protein
LPPQAARSEGPPGTRACRMINRAKRTFQRWAEGRPILARQVRAGVGDI